MRELYRYIHTGTALPPDGFSRLTSSALRILQVYYVAVSYLYVQGDPFKAHLVYALVVSKTLFECHCKTATFLKNNYIFYNFITVINCLTCFLCISI